ncbi:MAG: hypothetical protein CR989_01485 [Flavobacteriales bacterium]|nr:MAG: hypothetical protein CR989_01485 [Flavobacteriales bacterium]
MKDLFLLTIALFLLVPQAITAQKDTIWFDANWSKADKKQASYYRLNPDKKDNGFWITDYYMDGTKQMEAFSAAKDEEIFEGEVTWYHPNGKIMQTVNYKNNKPNGLRKNYYENGSLKSEYFYKDGKIHGSYISYYENAQKNEEGGYENGERTGEWKEYYKNGKLKGEGKYKNGLKIGEWIMYYYDGIKK